MIARHFESPIALLLLAAAFVVLAGLSWRAARIRQWRYVQLGQEPKGQSWVRAMLIVVGLIMFGLAAAGPRLGGMTLTPTATGRDLAIVIDASRSMLARDVPPDRFDRAKALSKSAIDAMEQIGGGRVAVIVFAAESIVVAPLTYDLKFAAGVIENLDWRDLADTRASDAVSGTRIGAAIASAVDVLALGGRNAGDVLLISDGDDPVRDGEWRRGMEAAVAATTPIHVIGVGDQNRDADVPDRAGVKTRLQLGPLRELADSTAGRYVVAKTGVTDLASFVRDAVTTRPLVDDPEKATTISPAIVWPWVVIGVALLAFGLSPWVMESFSHDIASEKKQDFGRIVTILAACALIGAVSIDDWMRRGDADMLSGRPDAALACYERAAERTTDPGMAAFNRGVALAAMGRHREAELQFRRSLSDAEGMRRQMAHYNLGTCLLRQNAAQNRQAIATAIDVLKLAAAESQAESPLADDIQINLAIAEKLLRLAPADDGKSDHESGDATKQTSVKSATAPRGESDGRAQPGDKAANSDGSGEKHFTHRPPPPGAGNLPMLRDAEALAAIAPRDVEEHLRRAVERIAAARRNRLRANESDKAPNYPDW